MSAPVGAGPWLARDQAKHLNGRMPRMGTNILAAASKSSSGSYTFLLVIVVLFGLFYFVMIRPQRNKQRAAQQMQKQAVPGQRVRTTAGMYATVVSSDDQDVVLEIAPGVEARFLRRAIMEVLPDDDGVMPADPDATDEASAADSTTEDGYKNELSAGQ
jgi:preprotein translocase subunit YajC